MYPPGIQKEESQGDRAEEETPHVVEVPEDQDQVGQTTRKNPETQPDPPLDHADQKDPILGAIGVKSKSPIPKILTEN